MEHTPRLYHVFLCYEQVIICSGSVIVETFIVDEFVQSKARMKSLHLAGFSLSNHPQWKTPSCSAPSSLSNAAEKNSDASGFTSNASKMIQLIRLKTSLKRQKKDIKTQH